MLAISQDIRPSGAFTTLQNHETMETHGWIRLPDSERSAVNHIAGTRRQGLLTMPVNAGLE